MKYSIYPHHRASGAAWLGQIPSHWKVARLRFLLCERFANGLFKKTEFWGDGTRIINVTDVYVEGDLVNESRLDRLECSDDELKSYAAKHGDFFVVRSSLKLEGIGKSAALLNPTEDTVFECHIVRGRPNLEKIHPRFLNLFMNSADARYYFMTRSNVVTMATIDQERIKNLVVVFPDYEEQQQIAAFLDWKTGQIDELMGKKKELLEKLKEKRIAVITQAVTQGLNPDAAMRDSGIPWLGQVPQHWEVLKMSWVCTSIRDGTHNPPERAPGIHRLLSVRNVQGGRFALLDDDRTMTPEDFADLQRSYTVEENDIVLAIVGATTGKSAIVGRFQNVTVQRSLAILRPDRGAVSSSFLNYVIQSPVVQTEIALTVFKYSAQPGIYLDDVGRLPVVKPPHEEQVAIAAWLDAETAKLDALAQKVESVIDRLTEYRSALITAATTGKIDVRKVKIPKHGA